MNQQTLEEVELFKYLRSTEIKDGTSIKEVKIRLAQAHSVMIRGHWSTPTDASAVMTNQPLTSVIRDAQAMMTSTDLSIP